MALTYEDSTLARVTTAVSSITTSFTITSANLIVVGTSIRSATDANRPVTGITYNAAALTKVREDNNDVGDFTTGIWYRVNPSTGANNVVTTCTGSINLNLVHIPMGLIGADTSNPVDSTGATSVDATGSSTSASVSVTTVNNGAWIVDVIYAKVDAGITVGTAGHTQRQNSNGSASNDSSALGTYDKTTAGIQAVTWTWGATDSYIMSACSFRASATTTIVPAMTSIGRIPNRYVGPTALRNMFRYAQPRYVNNAVVTAVLSGTVTASINETDIVAGGKTIILTLSGSTWVSAGATFDAQRANIIAGLTSAQSEANGWNAVVKALQTVGGVVQTSSTVVTITLDAQATYDITSTETITVTIPGSAVNSGGAIVAAPTFTVSASGGVTIFNSTLAMMGVG